MNGRAENLIYRHFLDKFTDKPERFIGVEIEMPVVNLEKEPVTDSFRQAMMKTLSEELGFHPVGFTSDGFPIRVLSGTGDVFSFETSFNTIEFSMAKKKSVTELADAFYGYLKVLKQLEKAHNHLICGTGINPYAAYADPAPLNTPSMLAKSQFLKTYTTHRNGEVFHAFSASTQTHLDAAPLELPSLLNLLSGLSFADALLFADALPFPQKPASFADALPQSLKDELDKPVLCFRDVLWRLCEAPNTMPFEGEYLSVSDVAEHLSELKVFIVGDKNGGYKPIEPVRFCDYFADPENPEEDIAFFRSLEPVAVSKHGTIEIRQTCTQPLSEIFAPVAFYAGIAQNCRKAAELLNAFKHENGLTQSDSLLRQKVVYQEPITPKRVVNQFLSDLLAVSLEGLKTRNFGEERFLTHLLQGTIECPAKQQLQFHGSTAEDMLTAYKKTDAYDTGRWGQTEYRYTSTIAEFDLDVLNRETALFCDTAELLPQLFTIQLVCEELLTNIVKYGAKTGGETVEVSLCVNNGKTVLTVSDNTAPFNPLKAETPDITLSARERKIGGLGLFMIKKQTQSVTYERKGDKNIVEIVV